MSTKENPLNVTETIFPFSHSFLFIFFFNFSFLFFFFLRKCQSKVQSRGLMMPMPGNAPALPAPSTLGAVAPHSHWGEATRTHNVPLLSPSWRASVLAPRWSSGCPELAPLCIFHLSVGLFTPDLTCWLTPNRNSTPGSCWLSLLCLTGELEGKSKC